MWAFANIYNIQNNVQVILLSSPLNILNKLNVTT